ncbi:RNA-dependent RNA polymerase 1 [Sporothrix schenckii 1099-18]|uniref:RNA-dependent RNA polymerase 1 n=1 Tax=Sporothrix schenckii 1099-18 TaxID=1397361 RepID=A0A0F2LZ94_SPOSC|nr:RNA-dependent RNA polymerase 1 [Sporothrix schenckii 1099-18]KJR82787.1 RNA-dependent RNA polymerase 1 [Sporothrix schenckii 1099-18]
MAGHVDGSTTKNGSAAENPPSGAENKPPHPAAWRGRGFVSMTLILGSLPPQTTTLDIYKSMMPLTITSIDILEDNRGEHSGTARVRMVPPDHDYWYDRCWRLELEDTTAPYRIARVSARVDNYGFRSATEESVKTPLNKWVPARKEIELALLGQGFMRQKRAMMVMDQVEHDGEDVLVKLRVNFSRRDLSIFVTRVLEETSPPNSGEGTNDNPRPPPRRLKAEYRIDIRFSWVKNIWEQQLPGGRLCVALALDSPPEYWRITRDATQTHGSGRTSWNNMEQWVRMAYLTMNQRAVRDASVSLNGVFPEGQAVDLGRWTVFRLGFRPSTAGDWQDVAGALRDYDLRAKPCPEFRFLPRDDRTMWDCVQADHGALPMSAASNMHHLSRRLSYDVAYQLEVCISHNILNESTLDVVFLESLAALTPDRATRMLEYVAERGKRIYQPHSIFRDPRAASYWRKSPPDASLDKDRAVYIRKAIVTPTTIIYSTPALEPGNRVLRHFREHHDRFLRVQFTDELLIGRLSGGRDGRRTDECFVRAFRALKNGICVGGRWFEFLAFGNSQLRENSTYFFAPTELVSCQDIRDWMGDFRSIKTVAKYAARLGQCLSTTRPVPTFGVPTTVQRIADVEHGRFCFTDGVGKISKWWARVIASHLRVDNVPSAVQFRMGGCKGILVVWPDVPSGQVVQIRPSQEKFPTLDNANILEIIRCSETATATLNQQTIILLSTLGVPLSVFLDLLHEELAGLDAVMNDPQKAVDQLMVRVDQNHITPMIADMVTAGFMTSDEPFVWSMLQLWRSWTLKALKEKARISVEKSAFVLGCVDETDTLRGHTQPCGGIRRNGAGEPPEPPELPQIFLQIPDLTSKPQGGVHILTRGSNNRHNVGAAKGGQTYRVITGFCLVGRNPSLHPGDLRVVEAVDVPALHHLRDVVVFPRTGDRDIPSMCSGGDLDGDDYFVFWDERLLPLRKFWNYDAMNYDAAREPDVDEVTPRHLISFFVQHMKHDTLPRIAMSHRAYADQLEDSAMNPRCLELAQLHSQAVDYAKTGVPALMPHRLAPKGWPHWMGRTFKRTYHSRSALGQIYDEVQVETFEPAYDKPFDKRILEQYPDLDADLMHRARRIKTQYDLALRRAMAQKDIESEFEMWSGFAMNKPRVGSDYKAAENLARLFRVITTRFRRVCLREAGGDSQDLAKLGPFLAAMYKVTSEEVRIALHEFALAKKRARPVPADIDNETSAASPEDRLSHHSAPLISFPWIFSRELCSLATTADSACAADTIGCDDKAKATDNKTKPTETNTGQPDRLLTASELRAMEYRVVNGVPTHYGIPLDISAYDGSREEEEGADMDAGEYEPMWTLPPGKSESDVVIEMVASTKTKPEKPEESDDDDGEQAYKDADYDFFTGRVSSRAIHRGQLSHQQAKLLRQLQTSMADKTGGNGHAVDHGNFPWAEMEDDILSTTSEESRDEKVPETIIIKREDDEEDEVVQAAVEKATHELPGGLAKPLVQTTEIIRAHTTARSASLLDTIDTVEPVALSQDVHDDADDEDDENDENDDENDIFATIDNLFGGREKRAKQGQKNAEHHSPEQAATIATLI